MTLDLLEKVLWHSQALAWYNWDLVLLKFHSKVFYWMFVVILHKVQKDVLGFPITWVHDLHEKPIYYGLWVLPFSYSEVIFQGSTYPSTLNRITHQIMKINACLSNQPLAEVRTERTHTRSHTYISNLNVKMVGSETLCLCCPIVLNRICMTWCEMWLWLLGNFSLFLSPSLWTFNIFCSLIPVLLLLLALFNLAFIFLWFGRYNNN